ncbi:MAG: alanine racemase [Desulfobacterales bacterium]|nr:alanine racemase [Desulfobacterales bacterium]
MTNQPNNVSIHLSALIHNLRQTGSLLAEGTRIMGIVKSDAYGHGLLPLSQTLEKCNIDCLGVAHLYEALQLRDNGIKLPIVVLCGIQTRDECREIVTKDLIPVIFDLEIAETLAQESKRSGKNTEIQLKVDTGMGRLGITPDETSLFIRKIIDLKSLELKGLMSHLSSADETNSDFTDIQIKRFEKAIKTGRQMGLELPSNNLANSAGIMGHKKSQFDMVRPGIMLYGGLPSPGFKSPVPLKPVMHFKGRILQVRDLPDQTPVSYGRTYHTNGPCRAGILSAGYGDGLPRNMSTPGNVLVGGRKVPVIGTICMNLTICDITGLDDIEPGDEVIFLGTQDREIITGDDMARWAGTISYEVFCSIGQRNNKEYS